MQGEPDAAVRVAPRQLQQWYRTLDRLRACKEETGTRCFSRCVTLFSLRVDMVFYDLTSTYFEGQGRPISAPWSQPRRQAAQPMLASWSEHGFVMAVAEKCGVRVMLPVKGKLKARGKSA